MKQAGCVYSVCKDVIGVHIKCTLIILEKMVHVIRFILFVTQDQINSENLIQLHKRSNWLISGLL